MKKYLELLNGLAYIKNGTKTLSIMTFSILTLSIKCMFETLSINDIQHITLSITVQVPLC